MCMGLQHPNCQAERIVQKESREIKNKWVYRKRRQATVADHYFEDDPACVGSERHAQEGSNAQRCCY